jgi:hypothetical protein
MARLVLPGWFCLAVAFAPAACTVRPAGVAPDRVNPALRAAGGCEPIAVSDALEALIAEERDTEQDRRYAYQLVSKQPVRTAQDAFARAAVAGRLAQSSGLGAPALVREAEQYARSSMNMDGDFRRGAAQRMLGTLYVLAPAVMLEHGDSETGLELLQELRERWPQDLETRLRLAEAFVALDDPEPARADLCFCMARQQQLRADDRKLLARLKEDAELGDCP